VKIVRKMPDYYNLAKIEVNVLEKLRELDPDGKQLVQCVNNVFCLTGCNF